MGSPDFIDFDAAWAEEDAAKAPPRVRLFGEDIDLPRGVPAALVLFAERRGDEKVTVATLTVEFVAEQLGFLVGPDRPKAWIDQGISLERLYEVYLKLGSMYRMAGDDPGEALPTATGDSSKTSSPDGGSSKPTGDASTEET